MLLEKGKEKIQKSVLPKRLGLEYAKEIVDLLQQADPDIWGRLTVEDLTAMFKQTIWVGIMEKGKLVSTGISSTPELGSHIMWVATHANHRNKGYATSIVSSLAEILLKNGYTIIFALNENLPAIKTYSKIGFKPYLSYTYLKT
jgi:predicted GNAT family acetyltransferase